MGVVGNFGTGTFLPLSYRLIAVEKFGTLEQYVVHETIVLAEKLYN